MLLATATILFCFIVLIWSADLFVAGAASIAENIGMSPIIIGLTIVSLGTSAPEILVSLNASLAGSGELAIGNAIGSNIANISLVLGVTLLIAPLMVNQSCMKKEVPLLLLTTAVTGILVMDGVLSKLDGSLMLGALVVIITLMVYQQKKDQDILLEAIEEPLHHLRPLKAWLNFLAGLTLLVASSKMLVWGAVFIATELGVSELVIGLTVVAIGTSLPELAATVTSALRGHTEIALGNIIGSNIFNLLAVMSIPGVFGPELLESAAVSRDYPVMIFLTLLLAAALYISRKRIKSTAGHSYLGRIVGTVLVSCYALYYCWLYVSL